MNFDVNLDFFVVAFIKQLESLKKSLREMFATNIISFDLDGISTVQHSKTLDGVSEQVFIMFLNGTSIEIINYTSAIGYKILYSNRKESIKELDITYAVQQNLFTYLFHKITISALFLQSAIVGKKVPRELILSLKKQEPPVGSVFKSIEDDKKVTVVSFDNEVTFNFVDENKLEELSLQEFLEQYEFYSLNEIT